MQDTTKIKFILEHIPFGHEMTQVISTTLDQTKEWRKKTKIQSSMPWVTITAKSRNHGEILWLEGSFLRFLQGHNVCGTNDIRWVCEMTLRLALDQLEIPYDDKKIAVAMASAELYRLDIAWNVRCKNHKMVTSVIRALIDSANAYPGAIKYFLGESIYFDHNSRVQYFKVYDKFAQMKKKQFTQLRNSNFSGCDELEKYAGKHLRCEVSLLRPYLKEHKLERLANWSKKTVQDHIETGTKFFEREAKIATIAHPVSIKNLTFAQRRVYALWRHGEELDDHFGRTALRSHVRKLKQHGLDLSRRPPRSMDGSVTLKEIFVSENIRSAYPKRFISCGIVAVRPKRTKP